MPRFTTSDGLSLHYTDHGQGPALLCLPGLTRNASDFDYVMPHLTGMRVICPDYRGRGQSDWTEDYGTYSIPQETQDVIALLDHLGIDRAAILGTSRGGLIALTLAALVPDRVAGVCFVDIGPVIETDGLATILGFIGLNPIWKTLDEAAEVFGSRIQGFDNVPASRWREEVEKHFVPTSSGLKINYDPKLRDAVLESYDPDAPAMDLWPLFDALATAPVAAIRGANSDLMSAQTLQDMQNRRPDMVAATIPDRGHVPFLDEDASVAVIKDWTALLGAQT
ncbi:alpha/beta hydrolase [Shimia litoralis]|uniref:Alpha/beta hydrolase n=1 Tax=Shimia litoralis TaxID=420403 RepID=A0A4U7NC16_9RHOB|nr:alpha/beta hydrolase [Shimia litoralis]TKZ22594.1 alpha/beta hydrolase [Shimia litoralis]